MRQQLREVGALSEEDINFRSESGRPGLRVKGVVRLQALPWQTVSQTALAALRTHAPAEHLSLEGSAEPDAEQLAPTYEDTAATIAEPQPVATTADTLEPALDREQIESIVEDVITPVLAFVRDQQAELTRLRADVERQADEMAQLREQVQRQADAANRVSAYFEALREAQSRLQ
jgi:hypothetical protein